MTYYLKRFHQYDQFYLINNLKNDNVRIIDEITT